MDRKVAVVTGSNKGVGIGIVRSLCKQFAGDVFLTARDEGRGRQAVTELEKEGLKPKFHQFDLNDNNSIKTFAEFLSKTYRGLDILVNNAGLAYKGASTAPYSEQAEMSMKTNYFGTLAVCKAMFPLLKSGARVVNVSSFASVTTIKKLSPEKQQAALACHTIDDVSGLMEQYVQDVKAGVHADVGWAYTAYGTSKLGVTLMTHAQQAELSKDTSRPDIVVNAVCPGYVNTDMTSHKGHKTIDEGADTPVYAALLPAQTTIRGQFISDRKLIDWRTTE